MRVSADARGIIGKTIPIQVPPMRCWRDTRGKHTTRPLCLQLGEIGLDRLEILVPARVRFLKEAVDPIQVRLHPGQRVEAPNPGVFANRSCTEAKVCPFRPNRS